MGHIRLDTITFTPAPASSKICTVRHRKTSDPDEVGNYTIDSSTLNVPATGILAAPFYINGLLDETSYTVKVKPNCGGAEFTKVFMTGIVCPNITEMTGVGAAGEPE